MPATTPPTTTTSSPFTRAVVEAVKKIYPEKLADSSFDNTGLLLEAPQRPGNDLKNSVLLTIDLTKAVADEAIRRKDSIVIAYHPIIFRGLKSLTLANTQQNSLLRLAQEGISVYSPHTAVDAAPGGLNDWLATIITGSEQAKCTVITPVTGVKGMEEAGYGRIVKFRSPQRLGDVIPRITRGLGVRGVSVATPQSAGAKSEIEIISVGICAGSGGSMLGGLDVDLLFTGELSHHEALAAVESGKSVVTAFHSNTERRFLREKMAGVLERQIRDEMGQVDGLEDGEGLTVAVSEVDCDPYDIVIPGQEGW